VNAQQFVLEVKNKRAALIRRQASNSIFYDYLKRRYRDHLNLVSKTKLHSLGDFTKRNYISLGGSSRFISNQQEFLTSNFCDEFYKSEGFPMDQVICFPSQPCFTEKEKDLQLSTWLCYREKSFNVGFFQTELENES